MFGDIPGSTSVFMRREKPGREGGVDAEKLRYPSIPSAEAHTLRIEDLEPDPNSSDEEEEEYISLETPLTTIVSAARSNQSKPSNFSEKEPTKQTLRKRIQKEKGYATPKNISSGAYEPVKEAPTLSSPAPMEASPPEETMLDIEVSTKRNLRRKRHPRVVKFVERDSRGNQNH